MYENYGAYGSWCFNVNFVVDTSVKIDMQVAVKVMPMVNVTIDVLVAIGVSVKDDLT